jgi:peptidoglycan/LPS O-acetylase OafA/YrhL
MADRKIHLSQIDPLRGLAILGVVLFHSLGAAYHADQLPWQGNWRTTAGQSTGFLLLYPIMFGGAGVILFFVISGFLIHYSITSRGGLDLRDFARKRFWRIYPPYAAAVLLFAGLAAAGILGAPSGAASVVAHLALIHNVRNDWVFQINPSFWSLATECQLYAIYPALWWVRRRFGSGAMLAVSAAVSLTIRVAADLRYEHEPPFFIACNPLTLWFEWTLGAYLCDQYLDGRRIFTRPKLTIGTLGFLIIAAGLYRPAAWYGSPLCAVLFAVLIESAVWSRPAPTRIAAALARLGLCSYSVYLLHQPLMIAFANWLRPYGSPPRSVMFLIVAATALGLSWTVGPLLYRWIELPSTQVGRRRSSAGSPPQVAASTAGATPDEVPAVRHSVTAIARTE